MLIVGNKKVALQVFSKKLTYVKYLEWYVLLLKFFILVDILNQSRLSKIRKNN